MNKILKTILSLFVHVVKEHGPEIINEVLNQEGIHVTVGNAPKTEATGDPVSPPTGPKP